MPRENQTFIGLRLDPELLAAVDAKRMLVRQTRSQFIRDAIHESVADMVPKDLAYPKDRVGEAKGGRPKKKTGTQADQSGKDYETRRLA